MYQPPESPRSIGGVLDDGFSLFRVSLPHVVALAFLGALAGQLPGLTLPVTVAADVSMLGPLFWSALAVSVVASLLCYGAVIGSMDAVARQRRMSVAEAFSLALGRAPALIGFTLLYGIIVLVGFLLLVIPGIILSLSLMFGFYGVLVDRQGPIEALKSSHRLVWGHWWRTAVIVTVGSFVMIVAYTLIGMVTGLMLVLTDIGDVETTMSYLELIVVSLVGAVVTPFFYALLLAVYYDLKLRRSGADLEARMGAAAGASAEA